MAAEDSTRATRDGAPPLARVFAQVFGGKPTRRVHAPGRVNLVGEHIDYLELPVLPMAIQRGVEVLLRPREDGRVRLAHARAQFEPREFELAAELAPFDAGDWGNYAKAAATTLAREHGVRRGLDAVVGGDLPPAAGLSSSSALVVALGLALLEANGLALAPLELATLLARAEQYVGTRSGGMDQAASLCGRAGCALAIQFAPLRVEPLPLPPDWRFVAAHSLEHAHKSAAAREAYNALRAAGEQALAQLTAFPDLGASARSYQDLCSLHPVEELLQLGNQVLPAHYQRAFRHAVTENARVLQAREAIVAGDAPRLGGLMNASQASLRDELNVSTPALDRVVEAARAGGALGARLTGAGFGGCAVALCLEADLPRVLAALEQGFYRGRPADALVPEPVFPVQASQGASVQSL